MDRGLVAMLLHWVLNWQHVTAYENFWAFHFEKEFYQNKSTLAKKNEPEPF